MKEHESEFRAHPGLTQRMEYFERIQAEHLDTTMKVKADTEKISHETQELLEMLRAAKGAWTVLEFVGKLAKPVGALVAMAAAFAALWTNLKR